MATYTPIYNFILPDPHEDGWGPTFNVNNTQRTETELEARVKLQTSYPGTAQTGHFNINGTGGVYALVSSTTIDAVADINTSAGNIYALSGIIEAGLGLYSDVDVTAAGAVYAQTGMQTTAGDFASGTGGFTGKTRLALSGNNNPSTYVQVRNTRTGSTNRAYLDLDRGDQANGYSTVYFKTAGTENWNVGTPAGSANLQVVYNGSATIVYLDGSNQRAGVRTTTPRRTLDVLKAGEAQIRLTYTDNAVYTDLETDSSGVLTITPSGAIVKMGSGTAMRSGSFTSGVNGWNIDSNGNVEFWNATIRGALTASVFRIGEMLALGGTVVLSKNSSQFNAAFTTPTTVGNTVTGVQVKKSTTGASVISNGDILWSQYWDGTGIYALYFTVSAKDDTVTGYSTCTLTLRGKNGTTAGAVSAVTVPKDAPFVNIGSTSGDTYMSISADGQKGGAGNITVITHDGSPWLGGTHEVGKYRSGNLKNTFDYGSTDIFGVIAGNDIGSSASSFKGFAVEGTNGFRLYNAAIAQYLTGVQTVNILANGTAAFGTNVSGASGITFFVTPPGQVLGSDTLPAGSVLIGPNTGPNMLWNGTQMRMRSATTVVGSWDATSFIVGQVANSRSRVEVLTTGAINLINRSSGGSDTTIISLLSAANAQGYYATFSQPISLSSGFGAFSNHGTSGTFASPGAGAQGGKAYLNGSNDFQIDFWNNGGLAAAAYQGGFLVYTVSGSGAAEARRFGFIQQSTGRYMAKEWAYAGSGANLLVDVNPNPVAGALVGGTYQVAISKAVQVGKTGEITGDNAIRFFMSADTGGGTTNDYAGVNTAFNVNLASTGYTGAKLSVSGDTVLNGKLLVNYTDLTVMTGSIRLYVVGDSVLSGNVSHGGYTRMLGNHVYMTDAYNSLSAGSYAFIGIPHSVGNFSLVTGMRFYRGTGENYTAIAASIDSTFVGEVASFKGSLVRFEVPWLLHSGSGYYLQLTGPGEMYYVAPAANAFNIYTGSGVRWWNAAQTAQRTFQLQANGDWLETAVGAKLTAAGAWTNASDRDLKEDFKAVDLVELEQTFREKVPVYNYRMKPEAIQVDVPDRHIGPVAQDFAAFGLGGDDTTISTADGIGVVLGLLHRAFDRIDELFGKVNALTARLAALEG